MISKEALEMISKKYNWLLEEYRRLMDCSEESLKFNKKVFEELLKQPILKDLEEFDIIKENLKYGYLFIGYDENNKPLFGFADTKLYDEIKMNLKY